MKLALTKIRLDGGTQPRLELSETTIRDYAEAMQEGDVFPPVSVFYDGTDHWLVDGFHRVAAAKAAGLKDIAAEVRQGTREDAVWASLGANAHHGLTRTNKDKRNAVLTALQHPRSNGMSARALARHCGVSHEFVLIVRRELEAVDSDGWPVNIDSPPSRRVSTVDTLHEQEGIERVSILTPSTVNIDSAPSLRLPEYQGSDAGVLLAEPNGPPARLVWKRGAMALRKTPFITELAFTFLVDDYAEFRRLAVEELDRAADILEKMSPEEIEAKVLAEAWENEHGDPEDELDLGDEGGDLAAEGVAP